MDRFARINDILEENDMPAVQVFFQSNCRNNATRRTRPLIRSKFNKRDLGFCSYFLKKICSKNEGPVQDGEEQRPQAFIILIDLYSQLRYPFLNTGLIYKRLENLTMDGY